MIQEDAALSSIMHELVEAILLRQTQRLVGTNQSSSGSISTILEVTENSTYVQLPWRHKVSSALDLGRKRSILAVGSEVEVSKDVDFRDLESFIDEIKRLIDDGKVEFSELLNHGLLLFDLAKQDGKFTRVEVRDRFNRLKRLKRILEYMGEANVK